MKHKEKVAIEAALRTNEPTTPAGWLAWEKKLDQVILRSVVKPIDGQPQRWHWQLRHPATERSAEGDEDHVTDCYVAIDRVVDSWFPEEEKDATTVLRLHP